MGQGRRSGSVPKKKYFFFRIFIQSPHKYTSCGNNLLPLLTSYFSFNLSGIVRKPALMVLSLLHTYISYTPIATAQKRNELTLAPPWTELTLNSTVAREMTIDSHVTRAPLHNFLVLRRVNIRKLYSGNFEFQLCSLSSCL